jgi:dTDP-4-dehydrorhamnose reductase
MKTAIIGASGFVGSHLLRRHRSLHPDCIGTCFRRRRTDLTVFDLGQPDLGPLRLVETGHEAVVITAAETDMDSCEGDPNAARINVAGTLDMIGQLGRLGIHVVFLSTDNVFDGRVGGYSDDSPPNPTTAYGRQKLQVEREIGNLCERYTVVRLSKTFRLEKGDGTLLDEMASTLAESQPVAAAYDLIFNPTWVEDVVEAIIGIQDQDVRGIINVANPEAWSRYDLAVAVADALGADRGLVRRVAFSELAITTNRPLNTSLQCDRLSAELAVAFRPVRDCVDQAAANWCATP